MKKAKVMLTGLAVLAVVGGALAFKAKSFNAHVIYCNEVINGVTECTLSVSKFTDVNQLLGSTTEPCNVPNAVTSTQWSTTSAIVTCNHNGTAYTTLD